MSGLDCFESTHTVSFNDFGVQKINFGTYRQFPQHFHIRHSIHERIDHFWSLLTRYIQQNCLIWSRLEFRHNTLHCRRNNIHHHLHFLPIGVWMYSHSLSQLKSVHQKGYLITSPLHYARISHFPHFSTFHSFNGRTSTEIKRMALRQHKY